MEKSVKAQLGEYGFKFKKAFGQNFLSDPFVLGEIAEKAGVNENSVVLEIGCGAGALTKELAARAKKVVGYEIDERLKPVLKDALSGFDNTEVIFGDVMKRKLADIEKRLGESYVLVANLPYYITTPIIMNFLENGENVSSMTVMVQKEVAERLAAKPRTSDYGAITVGINLRGEAKIVMQVPREKFTPVPNVDSAVVRIDIDKNKFAKADKSAVRELVRKAFTSRRKTLVNNISSGYGTSKESAAKLLEKCGISPTARAEELSAEQFVLLSEAIKNGK
ncbi:MAG TPA: 16S rRNA (adenine(1518)-N(6)/adenine(1519)-N(6))-dimethyltransferase [Clostridiales bacterium]|nr:16S rRNA (adenine(1518)-N(6)/adenine(1519)-N(6))-dimethyltransferase [Clostridiales bacterium]